MRRSSYLRRMLRTGLRCRSAAVLGAGLVAGAILTGCGAHETPTSPAAATGPDDNSAVPAAATGSPGSSATPTAASGLAAGLLPAEAFGNGSTVTRLPLDDLPDGGRMDHWWLDEGGVTPPECQ